MENNKTNLKVLNFYSNIKIPQYTEILTRGSDWILYGEDNLYPNYYISLMNRSAKHNAIVKTKSSMIAGNGISIQGLQKSTLDFIKNIYCGETLDYITKKIAYDIEIFGACALKIYWSNDRSKIAKIEYVDPIKVRIQKPNDYTNGPLISDGFYICEDWTYQRKYGVNYIPKFNPDKKYKEPCQLYYFKEHRPGGEWYGQPEYLSSVNWIELEYEVSLYHLSSIKDGFMPNIVINFSTGLPSDEEMRITNERLRREFGGSDGRKVMFTYSDGPNNAPVITPIELNKSDEKFIELNKSITEGILTGHRTTNPNLFGIAVPGELGGRNQMVDGLEVFNSMYIIPKQRQIEDILNYLGSFSGVEDTIKLNQYVIKFKTEVDIQTLMIVLGNQVIASEQKMVILMTSFGYSEEEAKKLIGQ